MFMNIKTVLSFISTGFIVLFCSRINVPADTFPPDRRQPVFITKDIEPEDTLWELPNPNCGRIQQIINHYAYTVSFNPVWHIPNWVAYELTAAETTGPCKRESTFKKDPYVVWGSADTRDYTKSNYDRGHMAPAADMRWNQQAMTESFYTSNICPQLHALNAGDWKKLENKGREWANRYGNIYIACGPIMEDTYNTIGFIKVAVPKAFFKVFFRAANGRYYGIGYLFDHIEESHPLSYYAMSIDEIEKITGLDFFYQLPDSIESVMEMKCQPEDWQ